MDFLELAKERYSCRNYQDKPVEDDKLNSILTACQLTPAACNKFPLRIVVLKSATEREKLNECTKFPFNAPLVLVCGYNQEVAWTRKNDQMNYGIVDTSLGMMNMMLEATNLGLATCFVGVFNEMKVKEAYNLVASFKVVGLLMLGYPADKPAEMHNIRPAIKDFTNIK